MCVCVRVLNHIITRSFFKIVYVLGRLFRVHTINGHVFCEKFFFFRQTLLCTTHYIFLALNLLLEFVCGFFFLIHRTMMIPCIILLHGIWFFDWWRIQPSIHSLFLYLYLLFDFFFFFTIINIDFVRGLWLFRAESNRITK